MSGEVTKPTFEQGIDYSNEAIAEDDPRWAILYTLIADSQLGIKPEEMRTRAYTIGIPSTSQPSFPYEYCARILAKHDFPGLYGENMTDGQIVREGVADLDNVLAARRTQPEEEALLREARVMLIVALFPDAFSAPENTDAQTIQDSAIAYRDLEFTVNGQANLLENVKDGRTSILPEDQIAIMQQQEKNRLVLQQLEARFGFVIGSPDGMSLARSVIEFDPNRHEENFARTGLNKGDLVYVQSSEIGNIIADGNYHVILPARVNQASVSK